MHARTVYRCTFRPSAVLSSPSPFLLSACNQSIADHTHHSECLCQTSGSRGNISRAAEAARRECTETGARESSRQQQMETTQEETLAGQQGKASGAGQQARQVEQGSKARQVELASAEALRLKKQEAAVPDLLDSLALEGLQICTCQAVSQCCRRTSSSSTGRKPAS